MYNIELSEQEAQGMYQVIDMAIKGWWIQIAETWILLNKKLIEAIKQGNKKQEVIEPNK